MCGDEASKLRTMLQISYPLDNGIIRNWEDAKHLWHYTFHEKLKVDPKECKVRIDTMLIGNIRYSHKCISHGTDLVD